MDRLTARQANLLRALIEGEQSLTSQSVVRRYGLGSPSTVITTRKSLVQKEILDVDRSGLYFQDPVFKMWLRRNYFGQADNLWNDK